MWAWLAQRISALALVVLLVLHLVLTYKPVIQFLLLLAVAFHAALGLRVILLDFNIVGVKYHRALIWGLTGVGLVPHLPHLAHHLLSHADPNHQKRPGIPLRPCRRG